MNRTPIASNAHASKAKHGKSRTDYCQHSGTGVLNCPHWEVPRSISFSGSGFLATYQLGVAQCLLTQTPWMLRTAPLVLGTSAGSLVAAAVVCEMSLVDIRDEMLHFAKLMKTFTLGPFNPSINVFRWLERLLQKYIPPDAHQWANGRLAVATTRLTDGKHTLMSEFQSKEDVVQALLCSCFVPGYCGMWPPSFKGVHYVDGGFSRMQPLPTALSVDTLTVSPFSGETDICPQDAPCLWSMVVTGTTLKGNMANSRRIINALYPFTLETLEQAFHSGYKDAFYFLQSNDLVPSLMMQNVAPWPHNQFKNKIRVLLDIIEDEETRKEEVTTELMCFTDDRCTQTDGSIEDDLTPKLTTKKSDLSVDVVKNALLYDMTSYLSMFGLTIRILFYLLLPVTLCVFYVFQKRDRLELGLRQTPQLVFWAWHGLRQFTVFFFNIFVCTIEKNIKDRLMPIVQLLRWLKIQAEMSGPKRQSHSGPYSKLSSPLHSDDIGDVGLRRRLLNITPLRDNKKAECCVERSTDIFL